MFGHLVQFVYLPMDIPQKQFIGEKCPNLLQFVERMIEDRLESGSMSYFEFLQHLKQNMKS